MQPPQQSGSICWARRFVLISLYIKDCLEKPPHSVWRKLSVFHNSVSGKHPRPSLHYPRPDTLDDAISEPSLIIRNEQCSFSNISARQAAAPADHGRVLMSQCNFLQDPHSPPVRASQEVEQGLVHLAAQRAVVCPTLDEERTGIDLL